MNSLFFRLGNIIFFIALIFSINSVQAQQDTEFWFAAPDASATHEDSPIRLRLSTENEPAQVTISQPANSSFTPYIISIPANSTRTVDLTSRKPLIEHNQSNVVVNKGLYIRSSALITAYYEIGQTFNIDIYTLKGKNALGQDFIAPGQTFWSNVNFSDAKSTIELVAAQNNTIVTMVPNANIFGHQAGDTILIRLNRGQSYSMRKISDSSTETLAGSVIQSTKPIAVSVTDDSMVEQQCYDLGGDQIVPIGILGKEYIVSRGQINVNERIFITGVEDGTVVEITGNQQRIDTIGYRQTKMYTTESIMHIRSSKPVYVMQYTGIGCELGAALIPSINCKGSNTIAFTRSGNDQFFLKLLVRSGGEDEFTLNGNSNFILASDFQNVPGTNGAWKIASISMSMSTVIPGNVYVVRNANYSFQLGFLDGGVVTGARYGYFSNFSSLFIGDDLTLCEGDTWEIVPKGQTGSTYIWSDGSTNESLLVHDPGMYWVEMTSPSGCVLTDTLIVTEKTNDFLHLPDTLYGCGDDEFTYQHGNYVDYQWSNGLTTRTFTTSEPGNYSLFAVNRNGCEDSDSMQVLFHPSPILSLIDSVNVCEGDSALIEVETPEDLQFKWKNGDTGETTLVSDEGWFWVEGSNEHCQKTDSIWVQLLSKPLADTIIGSRSVCPGVEGVEYWVEHETDEILQTWWNVMGGSISEKTDDFHIEVDWEEQNDHALIQLVSVNSDGCPSDTADFEVKINELLETETPEGLMDVCFNDARQVYHVMPTSGSVYTWQVENGQILAGQGTSEITVEWDQTGEYSILVQEASTTDITSCFGTSDPLDVSVFMDSAQIWMNFVSVDVNQDNIIVVDWSIFNEHRIQYPLDLYRREGFNGELTRILEVENFNHYLDEPVNTANISYGYQVQAFNFCNEEITTNIHQSMVLSGTSNEDETEISLSWNEYEGWDDGVGQYYVIRQLEDNTSYDTVAVVNGQTTNITLSNTADGFVHRIRIVAERADGTVSLSNHISFEFEHQLYIPNVMTPNSDNRNDYFTIPRIELYPQAKLSIYNRQATKVFSATGYQNDWPADNLSAGTYYYHLEIPNLDREYKGWFSVLR